MKSERDRSESKMLREYRKEIIRLKRQLREGKRENRLAEYADNEDELEPAYRPPSENEKNDPPKYKCPKCKSENTNVFEAGPRKFYRCLDCSAKGLIKILDK